jgi:hypothetical protein
MTTITFGRLGGSAASTRLAKTNTIATKSEVFMDESRKKRTTEVTVGRRDYGAHLVN